MSMSLIFDLLLFFLGTNLNIRGGHSATIKALDLESEDPGVMMGSCTLCENLEELKPQLPFHNLEMTMPPIQRKWEVTGAKVLSYLEVLIHRA